ncbi:MAG: hypothetical protein ETSY1_43055 [Candidatus Entotheonella factor]|uniref:HTH cro/C1-type domain-containing protein n=1 Tax=Entotheonella factor TaxID=1429438 RepID=W4L5F7_ENTF1|nr:MAG: hypothetical protein ETSY1_43055 [Candidatus Entotheonella factor]
MTKGPNLQKIWDELSEERRQKIRARSEELEAEYLTLQELRKAAGLTQASVSEGMNMPQSNVSRLEKSADMLLSTLRGYVEAVGGKLNLTVELPDKPPINLTGLGDLMEEPPAGNDPVLTHETLSQPPPQN